MVGVPDSSVATCVSAKHVTAPRSVTVVAVAVPAKLYPSAVHAASVLAVHSSSSQHVASSPTLLPALLHVRVAESQPAGHEALLSVFASRSQVGECAASNTQSPDSTAQPLLSLLSAHAAPLPSFPLPHVAATRVALPLHVSMQSASALMALSEQNVQAAPVHSAAA